MSKNLSIGKLMFKSNIIFLSLLAVILAIGYFFIDSFTPSVTEIKDTESLTIQNSARLYVPKEFTVKTLNGQDKKWKPKFTANSILVLLSPNTYTLTMDFKTKKGENTLTAKGLSISANLSSGRFYRLNYTLDKDNRISYSIIETEPLTYKTGFDPSYGSLIVAAIALLIAIIFITIARKKGVVFNLTED